MHRRQYLLTEKYQLTVEVQMAVDSNTRLEDMKIKISTAINSVAEEHDISVVNVRKW